LENILLTTSFVPGSPNWLDIGSADTTTTIAFYTGLFGWQAVSAGPDGGGYGFFQLDGKTVAAYSPPTEEGSSPGWTIYFTTADADVSAKLIEEAGGTVLAAPLDVMTAGRTGLFADPSGARFALWQPGEVVGLDSVNDAGTMRWVELHTIDPAAARSFYRSVLDWTYQDMPMGEFTYVVAATSGDENAFGGIRPVEPGAETRWHPYFEVTDTDAAVASAVKLGATVVRPAQTVADIGRFAALADPHGSSFFVITSANNA
jgi:hypothetical protein